jgi:cytoskeletal protein RodZ
MDTAKTRSEQLKKIAKKADKKLELVFGIVLIIVVVILGLFLILRNQHLNDLNNQQNTQTNNVIASESQVVNVDDTRRITLSNKEIVLPEGWSTYAIISNPEGEVNPSVRCNAKAGLDCKVYSITNGEVVFFASQDSLISFQEYSTVGSDKQLSTPLGEVSFNFEQLDNRELGDATSVPSSGIYSYVSGCIQENICFSTGNLPIFNVEENSSKIELFKSLISSIRIS